jgi:uncharacterized membrane protein
VATILAWTASRDAGILIAGLLLGSAIPTLLVILPTNKRLLGPSLETSSAEAAALLRRWGQLHAFRTIAGLAAFVLLLARLIQ